MPEFLIDAGKTGEDLDIGRFAAGQGGISAEPMIDMHLNELRNLKFKLIRLFLQDYFEVYPKRGVYNWKLLDRSVDAILAAGAKPLMCITFKPKILFPEIDQKKVEPNDLKQWEKLIYELVKHYNTDKKYGIEYWEIANEPDIGEAGGCPYLFTPANYPGFYEHTVKAVKRADPAAKVGGPALANYKSPILPALLKYCSNKKVPVDFVSWHMYNDDPENFKNSILHVKKLLKNYPKLKCETTINEWNVSFGASLMKHLALPEYQPCFIIEVINNMIEQGLSNCCYYHIRNVNGSKDTYSFLSRNGAAGAADGQNYLFNLLGLFDYQGIMRPAYFSFKLLSRLLGKKIILKKQNSHVKALAAYDPYQEEVNILLWNFAVKAPKKEKIKLKLTGLKKGTYGYRRFLLDAKTTSLEEEKKLKVINWEDTKTLNTFKTSFDLAPYGVTMINFKLNKTNKLVLY